MESEETPKKSIVTEVREDLQTQEDDEPGQIHDADISDVVVKAEPSSSVEFQPGAAEEAAGSDPPSKKAKLDVVVPDDYQDDEDEFPAEWKEMAGDEDEEEEDEGYEVTVDEARPRIDYRKNLLNKKNIDFNEIPEINGVPVTEFNIDTLEDKPWKKPGADISDYFNYGFNEDTWRIYCEKQRKMRTEAHHIEVNKSHINTLSKNDNSKYTSVPPPGQGQPQPFRAQFRRRPDGSDQRRDDRKPEGMGMMPPMMMGVPGMPFLGGMPPPMMPHPMGMNMMMGGMNRGMPPQMVRDQANRMQNMPSFGGNRRQLTSIPLTSSRPDAPKE